ncbi:hypothetical protein LTR15_011920 [Elasticomyces elasticus]|nr:hypothetical protein LTR15_011920 [Elasticomyces elasticus]
MAPSVLHDTISISGWQADWLARTLPAFRYYKSITTDVVVTGVLIFGFISFLGIRRCTKQLIAGTESREVLQKEIGRRVQKTCRFQWLIALFLLLNSLAVMLVDGSISVVTMTNEITSQPEKYDAMFISVIAALTICMVVVFVGILVLVPLAQMWLATSLLVRRMRKNGATSLATYLPEAQVYSTHIAQIWTMVLFLLMTSWPTMAGGFWRNILLQAIVGSTLTWLDVSLMLNFLPERITDNDLRVGSSSARKLVRLFVDAHSRPAEKDILPRYTAAATSRNDFIAEEKTPLTDTAVR